MILRKYLYYLVKKVGGEDKPTEWSKNCPKICTCHDSNFLQVPLISMNRLHHLNTNNDYFSKEESTQPSYKERNEVLDEEDETLHNSEENPIVRTAVCVVIDENEIKEALQNLNSIEVLTLLQSSETENITLRNIHFNEMKELKVLEIHGISPEKYNQNSIKIGHLFLKYDALNDLESLEYVNLQYIRLLGDPNLGNRIPPISPYDYMKKKTTETNQIVPIIQPDYEQKLQRDSNLKLKLLAKNLVFLTPNDIEAEIVPYNVYKEEQEKAGLYSFAGLANLKFLRIYKCNLAEINWEVFDGLPNLETLSLEGNSLLFVPEFAFYGTPNLKSLNLAHNNLLNLQYMSFAGLLQLQHLDVSYNNISHLSELSLPPFPRLQTADFSNNPIEIIFPSTFEIMNATQQLLLGSYNTVLDIQPNSLSGLRSLLKLSIKNIDVDILERELFRGMPHLRILKLSGKIKSISFDAFLDLPKLEKLSLKNCSIEKLSMDSFYGLYNLRVLDLSNNLLSSLPPGLFDQQFSLNDLYLQNNNLTTLAAGFFTYVPAKLIRLDENPWHCTCAMKDWKPAVVNQIKQKTKDNSMCQFRFDKGSMCSLTANEEYIYDKKVEPRCKTPKKFKEMGVFQVLHKELRCDKKQKLLKINRKAYIAQKLLEYENMMNNSKKIYHNKRINENNTDNIINDNRNNLKLEKIERNPANEQPNEIKEQNKTEEFTSVKDSLDYDKNTGDDKKETFHKNMSKDSPVTVVGLKQNKPERLEIVSDAAEMIVNYTNTSEDKNSTNNIHNNYKTPPQRQETVNEQKMSKKEREKLQLLKEKEERLRLKEKIKNSEKLDSSKLKILMQTELHNKRKEKLMALNSQS